MFTKLSAATALAALAVLPFGLVNGGPTSSVNYDYLFTINYKFGGASAIISTPGVVENINTYVGASIEGPVFNGNITSGVITNQFVPYGTDTIVFEEATWYGNFDNGDCGEGTFIATTSGLVDFELYEQQRVQLVLTEGSSSWLQYIFIDCGSIAFDLETASAAQDCYRFKIGNTVVLPPIFPVAEPDCKKDSKRGTPAARAVRGAQWRR